MTTEATSREQVLARRRRVLLIAGSVLLLGVAAVVIGSLARSDDQQPPNGSGLLPWPSRGGLVEDAALVEAAESLWRSGSDVDGDAVVTPENEVYVLWADRIGAGRVVIMEGIGTDGQPYVAQASEQGDPAILELNSVEPLPSDHLVALAVTYDGNLDLDGLEPGRGSALIQLLPEPSGTSEVTGLWRYKSTFADTGLERLELKTSGISDTFLQLDVSDPAGTPVVMTTTVGANAGVAGTIAVHGRQLVPTPARISLVDDPAWGASGRILGEEYTALLLAAEFLDLADANGFVAASEPVDAFGLRATTSLVVLREPDGPTRVACVVSDSSDRDLIADAVLADPAEVDLDQARVLAGACEVAVGASHQFAALAAARPGAGEVVLEAGGQVVAGPAESVSTILNEPSAGPDLVARLAGDDGPGSSFPIPAVAP
jgi:hypothetical protein